jgi:hypothetical protein
MEVPIRVTRVMAVATAGLRGAPNTALETKVAEAARLPLRTILSLASIS